MVVGQELRLCLIGLGAGLLASVALTRLMASQLYGISPTDPLTLAVLSAGAGGGRPGRLLPARQATRVDPMVALRATESTLRGQQIDRVVGAGVGGLAGQSSWARSRQRTPPGIGTKPCVSMTCATSGLLPMQRASSYSPVRSKRSSNPRKVVKYSCRARG